MEYIVNADIMSSIDNCSINKFGIPALVLMERAALAVADKICENEPKSKKIVAICGTGNNGGDGVCTARILHSRGYSVSVFVIGALSKCSEQTKLQLQIAHNLEMKVEYCTTETPNFLDISDYDVIIDAIFGIGLARPIKGDYALVVEAINKSSATVYSVDIPSGVNADNGQIMNTAVNANYTITFGVNKFGLLCFPGCNKAGEVTIADIGFPKKAVDEVIGNNDNFAKVITVNDYKGMMPTRKKDSNKGTYGRVLVVAGSKNMAGAAYFSAKAAYMAGAGLVQVFTCEANRAVLQSKLPEAILTTYETTDLEVEEGYGMVMPQSFVMAMNKVKKDLMDAMSSADSIVIGPGMGVSRFTKEVLETVLREAKVPVIIDADGINTLATMTGIHLCDTVILTPHLKEMSRLIHTETEEIKKNMLDIARNFELKVNTNTEADIITVLKDARTIISNKNKLYLNTSGNSGMSTGGSGDVLTGIIGAYVAAGMKNASDSDIYETVATAVFVHGLAADNYVKKNNEYSLTASDLLNELKNI